MDLRCPECGEPWDMDELHDVPGLSFQDAWRTFKRIGCAVFGTKCGSGASDPRVRAVYDVLGDDVDGAAAEVEDLLG